MRNRLERGKLNKARRGELIINAPIGYVRTPCGGLVLDRDDQVRAVVRLIFDKGAMIMRGSRVVRRAGLRGMLKGRVRQTCEHMYSYRLHRRASS